MGKKIAILVGVSKYNSQSDLPPCESDLELMTDIIKGSEKFDDFIVLGNSPTSVEAKDKISGFIRQYQNIKIDEVFVYYTGHGARHGDDFIYLFSDFDISKVEQTSLRNSEFDAMLKSLTPALTIKVVDACQAGTEYIKSKNDLEVIFKKSSSESFNKTYFLFSSSSSQSSMALEGDYSVFTKSFAKSLISFEGQDIRYRDVMAYISDDVSVQKHQTPLFIQQADNTEVFCSASQDLISAIKAKVDGKPNLISHSGIPQKDKEEQPELSGEDKLIDAIRNKSKVYCSEEEAQKSLSGLIDSITDFTWPSLLLSLYQIEAESIQYTHQLRQIHPLQSIAKWINDSEESYFAKVTYKDEEYESKEKVVYEENHLGVLSSIYGKQKRIEYQPVTKYRKVVDSFEFTAPSPSQAMIFNFIPKEEVLPWFKVLLTYVFSKDALILFYKYELEKEVSWNNRIMGNESQWQISRCELKNLSSINEAINKSLQDISRSLKEEINGCIV
ncbi:MAG: caspase family protein [Colwellia sp.]|nr:caspase family protein [Colwellia sp.]